MRPYLPLLLRVEAGTRQGPPQFICLIYLDHSNILQTRLCRCRLLLVSLPDPRRCDHQTRRAPQQVQQEAVLAEGSSSCIGLAVHRGGGREEYAASYMYKRF